MDCYTFLEWSHFFLLPWGGRVGVTYATCMTVSDLMGKLLLNAHSFIQNNKLCTLRKTYVDLKSQIKFVYHQIQSYSGGPLFSLGFIFAINCD